MSLPWQRRKKSPGRIFLKFGICPRLVFAKIFSTRSDLNCSRSRSFQSGVVLLVPCECFQIRKLSVCLDMKNNPRVRRSGDD